MTYKIARLRKAMTAIAAVLALTSPSIAQNSAPPEPVADTAVETTTTVDPLAPDASAETAVAPAAPKPKVETAKATAKTVAKPAKAAASTTRSMVRKTSTAATASVPAAEPAAPVEAAPPVSPPAAIPPPAAAEPAPPTVAAPASESVSDRLDALMTDDMALAGLGAGALGLLALGGAGIAMRRRKRRHEEAEFEARQEFLDSAEDEQPVVEPARADQAASGPAFAFRTAPAHDPVPTVTAETEAKTPETGNWESRQDAQFLFRRAARQPVEQD